jgi:hypothetical protein
MLADYELLMEDGQADHCSGDAKILRDEYK